MRIRARSSSSGDLNIRHSNGYVGILYGYPSYTLDQYYGTMRGYQINPSDSSLKKDIKPIKDSKNSIMMLNGVSYVQKDESNIIEFNKSFNRHYGFIAQEVKEVFPEIVYEDSLGVLSVEYTSLIALIIEAFKEQHNYIDSLNQRIQQIESSLSNMQGSNLKSENIESSQIEIETNDLISETTSNAFLYQNDPNPFNEDTEIRFYLPENIQTSVLYIFDMQGIIEKAIPPLQKG